MEDEIEIKTIKDELALKDKVELILLGVAKHLFGVILDNVSDEEYITFETMDKKVWIINTRYIVASRLIKASNEK